MDVIKVEPDSDCETHVTSICNDVKEEKQCMPTIKQEDEVGLLVYFSFNFFLSILISPI